MAILKINNSVKNNYKKHNCEQYQKSSLLSSQNLCGIQCGNLIIKLQNV